MFRIALVALAALGLAALILRFASGPSEEAPEQTLSGRLLLTGSSTIAPLAAELGRRFEERHPGVRVDVETGGSARGLADVRRGLADIGMVSRALADSESDLDGHLLARDGIAIIVHARNPVPALTSDQIVGIYTGAIETWRAIDGRDAPITLVHKAEGRSTLEVFLDHFGLDNRTITPDVVIGDNQQGIKTVAANPTAIGYVSIGAAEAAIAEGEPIRLLTLDGIPATTSAVAAGRYPLARELNLVIAGPSDPLARTFLEFATSSAADDLIEGQYFVPPRR